MIQFCYLILYLGIEAVLSSVVTDGKDGHGLTLEQVGPTFSSFNAMRTKITKKIIRV